MLPTKKASKNEDVTYAWTGNAYSNILIANGDEVSTFDPKINTRHNEGTPTFNGELTDMYFTRCFTDDHSRRCPIMNCHRTPSGRSEPFCPAFRKNVSTTVTRPSRAMAVFYFFPSDDPGGWGGSTIFMSVRRLPKAGRSQTSWRDFDTPAINSFRK